MALGLKKSPLMQISPRKWQFHDNPLMQISPGKWQFHDDIQKVLGKS